MTDQSTTAMPCTSKHRCACKAKAPKRKKSWVRRLVTWVLVTALVLMIVRVGGCAERLFYYPFAGSYSTPAAAEEVLFVNEGRTLHGWFYPARGVEPGTLAPTIVFCHGNAYNISRHTAFMDFLPAEGFNVFIFDYRSYGSSDKGPLHRDGLIHDASAAIDAVFERDDIDPDRVGVYGMSLGGNIGLAAAAEDERIRGVCSVSTFSTWPGVASDYVPVIADFLIPRGRDAVDSAAAMGDRPLMILHGTADGIVDIRHAAIIRDSALAAGVAVELRTFEGIGHTNWVTDSPEMRGAIGEFFAETLGEAGG